MAHGLKSAVTRSGGISLDRKIACLGAVIVGGEDKEAAVLAEFEHAKRKPPRNPKSTYQQWRSKILSEMIEKENQKVIETCKAEGIYTDVEERPKFRRKPRATKVVNA